MICPWCRSEQCRRSKRRSLADHILRLLGLLPWRCRICQNRFFAWSVPVRYAFYVHCAQCGNLELQRLGKNFAVESPLRLVYHALHVPAYRCDACRHRFFSMRIHHPVRPTHPRREPQPAADLPAPPPTA